MSWDVQLAPSAIRGLDRLPPRIAAAVVEFTAVSLRADPERMSKPLRGEFEGLRSARRGDYRVLFSLDEAAATILIVRVAHRADVYGIRRPSRLSTSLGRAQAGCTRRPVTALSESWSTIDRSPPTQG